MKTRTTVSVFAAAAASVCCMASAPPVENAALRIEADAAAGRIAVRQRAGDRVFAAMQLAAGEVARAHPVSVPDLRLGAGRGIEVPLAGGDALRLMLAGDAPFVLLQRVAVNAGADQRNFPRVEFPELRLDVPADRAALRVLGTGGLTAPDRHPGSYAFLAVADPATRRGIVGAWLTHDRGCGVVFSSSDASGVAMRPAIDYGRLLVPGGGRVESEIFVLGFFEDARLGLEAWADQVARWYDIRLRPKPDGYCTWYSQPHGGASDAPHLAELAAFAAKELKPYGFQFVQIDDRWQDGTMNLPPAKGPARVFARHKPDGPYPEGMTKPADGVKRHGFTAGLWFLPFAGDPGEPFFAGKERWFVKRPDGSPYWADWGGFSLDLTQPEALDHVADVARRIVKEWGYGYLKMDGLWLGTATQQQYVNNAYKDEDLGAGLVHRPEVTPIEAYRNGLRRIREAAGDDAFLLGCNVSQNMRTLGGSIGLFDAMRIGPDNGPKFDALKRGPWHGSNRYFFHGRIWHNDPDPVYVRATMPLEHARLICSWVAVSGQLNVSSDWLPGLPPERLEILKRTLPSHQLKPRPVDLFDSELPRIWLLTDERDGVRRDVVGLFNWDDKAPVRIRCQLGRIGLPPAAEWVGFDFWAREFLPSFSGELNVEVPAGACRILAVRPVSEHPQVLSTSRHISQGIVDLAEEKWDEAGEVLEGASRVVAGDPCELRIALPAGAKPWKLQRAELVDAPPGGTMGSREDGAHLRATIASPATGIVRWRMTFCR